MQSQPQRPTSRHHYLPEFYLKRWTQEPERKLLEYSRRERVGVVGRRTAPGGTAWQKDLYKAEGMPPEVAYAFEEAFFAPVDSLAAETLGLLETHGEDYPYRIDHRRAWGRFVVSLLTRTPEDVLALKTHWRDMIMHVGSADEAEYAAARKDGDPATFAEYLALMNPGFLDGSLFKTLAEIIDGGRIGEDVATMHWTILSAPPGQKSLLTSDRPLLVSQKFGGPAGHLAMPISPRRLFVAARDPEFTRRLVQETTVDGLIRYVNEQVVGAAKRFVYADDEKQARFVRNRLGTTAGPSAIEQTISWQREKHSFSASHS